MPPFGSHVGGNFECEMFGMSWFELKLLKYNAASNSTMDGLAQGVLPPALSLLTHPASPLASMWLAVVTSLDQTSYCHLRRPRTPQRTRPVWIPTRMFSCTSVASTTWLQGERDVA